MTNLLIAFVIPIIVIIVSAILQTLLRCPFKVAGIVFVALIITAIVLGGTLEYIVLAWLYTLLALIIALIVRNFFRHRNRITNGDGADNVNNINTLGGVNNMNDYFYNPNCGCNRNNFGYPGNNIGFNNRGFNNIGNNNTGNNNLGSNNIGNNNTGNCNCGNNNFGNNNIGSNNGYNPYNRCGWSNFN